MADPMNIQLVHARISLAIMSKYFEKWWNKQNKISYFEQTVLSWFVLYPASERKTCFVISWVDKNPFKANIEVVGGMKFIPKFPPIFWIFLKLIYMKSKELLEKHTFKPFMHGKRTRIVGLVTCDIYVIRAMACIISNLSLYSGFSEAKMKNAVVLCKI